LGRRASACMCGPARQRARNELSATWRLFLMLAAGPESRSTTHVSGRVAFMFVRLTVNGSDQELEVEPRVSLLDALRERLGAYGDEKGLRPWVIEDAAPKMRGM
jgi:hypothetical protein